MSRSDRDESGFTIMEVTIASAILLGAIAVFFSSMASLQGVTQYQQGRSRALDDLRITAGTFAKDARHAANVTAAAPDSVTMETYVGGTLKTVKYEVVVNGTERDLKRVADGGTRLFVIKLTDNSIFSYDNTDPTLIRRVQLHMETKPNVRYAPVVLATEVSLRNVTG